MAVHTTTFTTLTWHLVECRPDGRRKVVDSSSSEAYILSRMAPAAWRVAADDSVLELRATGNQVVVQHGDITRAWFTIDSCDSESCGSCAMARQRVRRLYY
jgi:hypothetical protein